MATGYKYLGKENMPLYYSMLTDKVEKRLAKFIIDNEIKSIKDEKLTDFLKEKYKKYDSIYTKTVVTQVFIDLKEAAELLKEAVIEEVVAAVPIKRNGAKKA